MREGRAFSIELVDADGRKVRVAVGGKWGGLNAEVAARIVDRLGYELSDMESWTPEPPSGTIIWAAPDSERTAT